MTHVLETHTGTVNIGGRTIINPRLADYIDVIAGIEQELANLVKRMDKHLHTTGRKYA